jgi:hypothetical protein
MAMPVVTRLSRAGAAFSSSLEATMPIAFRAGAALFRASMVKPGMTRWSRAGAAVSSSLAAPMPIACWAAPIMTTWMAAMAMIRSAAVLVRIR